MALKVIITYLDGCLKFQKDRLRDEDFSSLGAQITYFFFQQLHLLAGPTSSHLQKPVDDRVEVNLCVVHVVCPLVGGRSGGVVISLHNMQSVDGSCLFWSDICYSRYLTHCLT